MKSTVDKLEGLNRKLHVEIPAETVHTAFEKAYKALQREAHLKGFRKGKAPLAQIKLVYKDQIKGEVLNNLIYDTLNKALDEHSLDPVGNPNIHFETFSEENNFKYSADFEVRPEIHLKTYENLKVQKEKLEIPENRIDTVIENFRKNYAETAPILELRPAQMSDLVEIDFEGFVDNGPLEGGKADNFKLELGSQSFIPGFEEAIVGMEINSTKTVNLQFPDDYHSKTIAGKPVEFKVTLKSLHKKVLPEVNDELVQKINPELKTLSELKDYIKKEMSQTEEQRIKDDLHSRLLKAFVAANPVEVPQKLKDQQKKMIIDDVKQKMNRQGMSEEEYKSYVEKWSPDFEESAMFMIRSAFLVGALADKLNVHPTPEEVEQRLRDYAKSTGIELKKVKEFYNQNDRLSNLRYQITEKKVIEHLLEKAQITEVDKDQLT